jgi:hypothetical protein
MDTLLMSTVEAKAKADADAGLSEEEAFVRMVSDLYLFYFL